nr:probable receptor-like protein kinase At4g39110 [Tanacetum cinerariifolium]
FADAASPSVSTTAQPNRSSNQSEPYQLLHSRQPLASNLIRTRSLRIIWVHFRNIFNAHLLQNHWILGRGDISMQSQYLQYKGKYIAEYLMNVTMERLNIKFSGLSYVNTIKVVSAPHMLIEDVSDALFSVWKKVEWMSRNSFQRMYRLNVGNMVISPGNDTLGWALDSN